MRTVIRQNSALVGLLASGRLRYYMPGMSTEETLQIDSLDYEQTVKLASQIGERLRGGEVVELISDLGGGKTAFVTGLAKGAGSSDPVSSPSFTINNIYQAPTLTINHYDLYRLADPGIMKHEIAEAVADPKTVLAIEWGESVADVLPNDRLTITITATGENSRKLKFGCPPALAYLLEDLK